MVDQKHDIAHLVLVLHMIVFGKHGSSQLARQLAASILALAKFSFYLTIRMKVARGVNLSFLHGVLSRVISAL